MACIDGSDLLAGRIKTRVQDAYSMRSSPQVIGAAHDAVAYVSRQVEIELNGVGDNPVFLPVITSYSIHYTKLYERASGWIYFSYYIII